MAGGKEHALKSFNWFEVNYTRAYIWSEHIKHLPSKESLAFVNSSIQENAVDFYHLPIYQRYKVEKRETSLMSKSQNPKSLANNALFIVLNVVRLCDMDYVSVHNRHLSVE